MSLMTGHKLKLSIFGQSHSQGMGVVLDGLPAGETIDLERVQEFLRRRAPGQGPSARDSVRFGGRQNLRSSPLRRDCKQ